MLLSESKKNRMQNKQPKYNLVAELYVVLQVYIMFAKFQYVYYLVNIIKLKAMQYVAKTLLYKRQEIRPDCQLACLFSKKYELLSSFKTLINVVNLGMILVINPVLISAEIKHLLIQEYNVA